MKYEQGSIQRIRRGALGVRAFLGIVVTIGSAACAPQSNPTHQTVDYYRANPEVRQARLAECANDPGALGKTADCVNVRKAEEQESIGSLRDLPPVGLLRDLEKKDSTSTKEASGKSPDVTSEREGRENR